MRLVYATLVPVLAISAQQIPNAAQLLNQRVSSLQSSYSYRYTEQMTSGAMSMFTTVEAVNPSKLRVVSKSGDMEVMTVVTDGHSIWIYMPMFKKYSKVPAVDGAISKLTSEFDGGNNDDGPELAASAKVIRSEALEIDGQPHDCWVIEAHALKINLGASETMDDVHRTFWIDKATGVDLQTVGTAKIKGTEVRTKRIKTSLKLNERIDDVLFVFTPPADAVEADEVMPGMKALLTGTPSTPATPAAVSAGYEPEAFILNMFPFARTEPEPSKDAHGIVTLLLTIDPGGSVVKAEPLTGPKALRSPAINAVTRWKFHSVIRHGQPVYAYTQATVSFFDPSKPSYSASDMGFDVSEQMASGRRIAELQEKFPRSPQQVLAGLERDRGSTTGMERSYALPDLAKAAVAAGELDKATDYANEMLRHPSTADPFRGQAVHDGNTVLGLVSLKQGDLDRARGYLLEAGKSKGSPVLDSFGPNMRLAKELLDKGEKEAVLQYFSSCRTFWKLGQARLDEWSALVRQGGLPDFGANLTF